MPEPLQPETPPNGPHGPANENVQAFPPTPPSQPGFTIRVFYGPDGLRAVWGILLFLGLNQALLDCEFALAKALFPRLLSTVWFATPGTMVAVEGMVLLAVAVAAWLMGKIEHRPTAVYGLGGKRRLRNVLAGLGWGVAMLSLLVFCLRATGLLVFDERLLFGASALRYGAGWLAGFLVVGLFEEYFYRGYLQFTLARGIGGICRWMHARVSRTQDARSIDTNALGFWTASLLLSFGFGFSHHSNLGESPIGLLSAGLIGLVFCLSLWRTGSLWWAIGFHASWDWAQSFLYGVADSGTVLPGRLFASHPVGRPILSGGLTGPEGSLFILPLVGLIAAIIVLTLPRTHFRCPSPDDPRGPSLH